MKKPIFTEQLVISVWHLIDDDWVLYTENASLLKPALAAGLRPMAKYAKDGRLFAYQFVGTKEAVWMLAHSQYPPRPFNVEVNIFLEEIKPEYRRRCKECKRMFTTESKSQRYCEVCAGVVSEKKKRERNRRYYMKRSAGSLN